MPPDVRPRLGVAILLSVTLWVLLAGRLLSLQIVNGGAYRRKAERQNEERVVLEAERGDILDRNRQILAASLEMSSICAVGYQIENPERVAKRLSGLGLGDEREILRKLDGAKGFCWLKRGVSERIARRIEQARIAGVYRCRDSRRYYPRGALAGNLLGFAGKDGQGLEGIEYAYEHLLGGRDGWAVLQKDPRGGLYPFPEYPRVPPRKGKDIILTIDASLQEIVEEEIEKTVGSYTAKAAIGIMLNPKTGEILAMANCPSFNPNLVGRGNPDLWRNRAICDLFEPGSTFKIVMAIAGLAGEAVSLDETLPVGTKWIEVSGVRIRDWKEHGDLTFEEVIWRSSNIGAVKVAQRVGEQDFYLYARALGFGCRTGVDLPGEVKGCLPPPDQWSPLRFANLAFGQGVSVTALQLACAYAAIANSGVLVKPRIVKAVVAEGGSELRTSPQVVRRVLPEDLAETIKKTLLGVVEKGTGMGARIEAVPIAGKTGTAEKSDGEGGYRKDCIVASFVGFFPAHDPSFLLCLVVDEPRGVRLGGDLSARLFRRIVRRMLHLKPYRTAILPPQELAGM